MNLPIVLAQMGGANGIVLFVVLMGVMYVMLFWPQQRQLKQHRALIASLKKGDEIVTQSGLIGKIATVGDKELIVEVASGVKVRMVKTAVQTRATEAEAPAKLEEKKEEK